jgi:outer membrane receptor protein involved in Fe transport
MFYATWSKGFRPGGINRQPGLAPYKPDFLINYEVGWKTSWGPVRWNGAINHQKWQGFQFSFLGENSLTVVQNGRNARINGIETDVGYVSGGLSLNAAAAYTDSKTSDNVCAVASDQSEDCSDPGDEITAPKGTRLPITPKLKITGTARYTWDLGAGKAHAQAGIVHQSSARSALRDADQALTGTLPAYTLVDLFLGYDWSRYNVEAFATNVFDTRNQLSRSVSCSICTNIHIVPGTPRTIGIRLGAKF